jgi:hypothetical protein
MTKFPLTAPPAEFKTAGPPATPGDGEVKKLKLGRVFGTDGSDSPAWTLSTTVCVGAAVRVLGAVPVVKVPIVIPPEEVMDAVSGVVLPLRLVRTP